jgi:hypothetical protein
MEETIIPSSSKANMDETATTTTTANSGDFNWTATTIVQSIVLFFLAGVAEIVGGWLIW